MNGHISCKAILLLAFGGIAIAQQPSRLSFEQLNKRGAERVPTREQLRYQEIPWVHDLAEAQKVARTEGRPIFLWGYGGRGRPDNGLEGC